MEADSLVMTVRDDELEIPIEVTRKRVKNLNLRVRRDGSVVLSIPLRTSLSDAQAFLDRKAHWIAAHARRAKNRQPPTPVHHSPATGRFPLWGSLVPLESPPRDQDVIKEIYRSEVQGALPEVIERMERRIGVHATSWHVRTMETRWGSCTPSTGSIRINARLAAYPPECLEFVVAHELVHLLEPSHNERFHALLDECCPENRHLAQLLRQPVIMQTKD